MRYSIFPISLLSSQFTDIMFLFKVATYVDVMVLLLIKHHNLYLKANTTLYVFYLPSNIGYGSLSSIIYKWGGCLRVSNSNYI